MDYSQEINTQRCNKPCKDPIFTITSCVAQIDGRFFLLVEIEIEGTEIEQFTIREITAAEAAILIAAGVMRCQIVTTIPTGREVEIICAFVVGANVFVVFSVENATDRLVLVRVPLCTII